MSRRGVSGALVGGPAGPQGGPGPAGPAGGVVAVQIGAGVFVAGVSAAIPATITASSRIVATRSALNGSAGIGDPSVLARFVGAPGSFVVSAIDPNGIVEIRDVSSFDWIVVG